MYLNGWFDLCNRDLWSWVDLDDEVDSVTPLALEPDSDIVPSWATKEDARVRPVTIGLLIKSSDLSNPFESCCVECPFVGYYPAPGGILDDTLPQYKSVARHSISNDQVMGLVRVIRTI